MVIRFIRALATLAFLGIVGWGMFSTDGSNETTWLLCVLAAGACLLIAMWPIGTRKLPIFNRTMMRWSTIVLACFIMISIQLVKIQIVESEDTFNRIVVTENGEVYQNARVVMGQARQVRGSIYDRNGQLLVGSAQRDDGTWERTYPEPSVGQVIGYYSPPLFGASQIEASFNDYLSGTSGGNPVVEWFDGLLNRQRPGHNLELTLDLELQKRAVELLGERNGAVVLMDASTGEVLAITGYPAYDPSRLYANVGQQTGEELDAINEYWAELVGNPDGPLVFRPTQGLFTPGSVFKTITATAALAEGVANPGTIYRNEGALEVDGRIIIELNRPDESKVDWTLEESYSYSLNVVFAQIGLQLGAERLWDWAERFGMLDEAPFDVLTDAGQLASSLSALQDSQALVADTAFGQGEILTSPLEMAMVVAAIANDGNMMRPRLVSTVTDANGKTLETFRPEVWRNVVSPDIAAQMRSLMVASADYGYASAAWVDGVEIGAKTGTAETGQDTSHAWFTGYAMDGNRKLVVSVIVEHAGSGGTHALPIGRELLISALAQERVVD
jgi:peptidoglycan glycosyltransferase